MNKPRGLVLGWYNQLNAGDDRLATCISYWLKDHQLLFMPHTSVPDIAILNDVDYVLLGGGSIANSVSGVFCGMHEWIRKARIPVFCVGIGVSHFPEFHCEFTAIKESGGHIWVRDQPSAENCGQPADAVDVAPDLSWLLPLRFANLRRQGIAVNLRPGGGPRNLHIAQWRSVLTAMPGAWSWPLCFGKDDDVGMLHDLFGDCKAISEFDPTGAGRAEILVAMRFHAVIFAIQTGTPFVAITHTRKLELLLEQLGFGYATVPHDRPDQFCEAFQLVKNRMSTEELLAVTDSVHRATVEYAAQFKERVESAIAANSRRSTFGYRLKRKLRIVATKWT